MSLMTGTLWCARTVVALAALLVAGLPAALLTTEAAAPSAKLDFKLPKSTTLGEPAIMTARLFNTTGYRIMADFGVGDQTEFVFLHSRPDGSKVRVTPSLMPTRGVRTSRLMLRDTSYTASVVLDEWLDLSQIGRHALDVEFRGSVRIDGGDAAGLKRTTRLGIEVKPRDTAQLEKRGADWLKQISTLSPDNESRVASLALAMMRDPVAVPYLELAATRTRSGQFIAPLKSMGTPEARGALERLAKGPDPEVRALAQKALDGR